MQDGGVGADGARAGDYGHGDAVPADAVVELAVVGEDAGSCDADDGVAEVGEGGGIVSESR